LEQAESDKVKEKLRQATSDFEALQLEYSVLADELSTLCGERKMWLQYMQRIFAGLKIISGNGKMMKNS